MSKIPYRNFILRKLFGDPNRRGDKGRVMKSRETDPAKAFTAALKRVSGRWS